MKRHGVLATVAALVIVGAAVATWVVHRAGPVHRGRTVRSWLAQVFDPKRSQPEAMKELREMGAQAVPGEIEALTCTDSALARIYEDIRVKLPSGRRLPELVDAGTIRSAAEVALLNNPHTGEFIPQLAVLLKHRDPMVRTRVAGILVGQLRGGDTSCLSGLIAALDDSEPMVRRNMADALAQIGPPAREAVPILKRGLMSQPVEVRIEFARALSLIDTHDTALIKLVLKGALADDDARIRHWAAVYLGQIDAQDEQIIPVLVGSLSNPDPGIRMSAAYSLLSQESRAKPAVPGLIRALADSNPGVQHAARAALERIDPEAARRPGMD